MDLQTLVNIAVPVLAGAIGWFVAEQKRLERELADLHVKVVGEYVPHSRFDGTVNEINRKLDTIITALADKADRE